MEDKGLLQAAEKYLKEGNLVDALSALSNVTEHTAEYYFLQSEADYLKGWTNECRKNLEKAVELDPENKKYKEVLDKIVSRCEPSDMSDNAFENPYGRKRRAQMGAGSWKEACCEGCGECGCMCCLEGVCEGICNGL